VKRWFILSGTACAHALEDMASSGSFCVAGSAVCPQCLACIACGSEFMHAL